MKLHAFGGQTVEIRPVEPSLSALLEAERGKAEQRVADAELRRQRAEALLSEAVNELRRVQRAIDAYEGRLPE